MYVLLKKCTHKVAFNFIKYYMALNEIHLEIFGFYDSPSQKGSRTLHYCIATCQLDLRDRLCSLVPEVAGTSLN